MRLPATSLQESLVSRLKDDLLPEGGPPYKWESALRTSAAVDGFSAILDDRVSNVLFSSPETPSFDAWILKIDSWLENLWDPCRETTKENVLLSMLWDCFEHDLADNLRRARVAASVPAAGGVLAYVAALSKCIVMRYSFAGLSPKLVPVAVIDQPLSAFDFWGAIDHASASARNSLKTILASGHKLIYQNGVLAHVDRRTDAGVFGPSIDTLLLGEILARHGFEKTITLKTALEIGSGSGFLAASIVRHSGSLEELFCIDLDSKAIACTEKNIKIVAAVPGVPPFTAHFSVEKFDPKLINKRFDLVVCNPPYIPYEIPPEKHPNHGLDFIAAVSGTGLFRQLLGSVNRLLTKRGKLLLMLSNLCMKQFNEVLIKDLVVDFPLGVNGFRVIFDVEAVLDRPEWLEYLRMECGLEKEGETFFHYLHPVWISKKET